MYLCTIPIEEDFLLGVANESNLIEYSQQTLLFLSFTIGFISLKFTKNYRIFMSAISLFLVMHLIRELDAWFDGLMPQIGWFPFVLIIIIITVFILIKNFITFLKELESVSHSLGFGVLLISLANLHVFTRIYGKPANWRNILGDQYSYNVERASEESVELVAYMMIFIAMIELFIYVKNKKALSE
jgi:hypothetical protein